jgi:hypothetical protein
MEFLKNNYEKIILGIVLVGLAVAVAFIPFKVSNEKKELDQKREGLIPRSVKPLTNLDLTLPETALKRVAAPAVVDFSAPHRLFNPMPWQKGSSGQLIKYDDSHIGPKAVTITRISPLFLIITLDKVNMSDAGPRYVIGVQKEAASQPSQRVKKETYSKPNDKNDVFMLRKVDGPPENPTKLTLELNDSGEAAVVTPEQPFKRVDGYIADMKYDPEKQTWNNCRMGRQLHFNGEDYNVVAISQTDVVLSAKSNQKKWPVTYNPTNALSSTSTNLNSSP